MRLEEIRAEWRRGAQSLHAAQLLEQQGLLADAISRAYYAVMHASKAALLVHDATAESHRAVRRLFGQVLVKPGEIEKEWAEILSYEQEQRAGADYDVGFEADAQLAAVVVRDARRFVERMAEYLGSKGVTLEQLGQAEYPLHQ